VANKQAFHIAAATAGANITTNPHAILGSLYVNTAASAATSSILTLFDGPVANNKVIAVINVQNNNVPGWSYDLVTSSGISYSYVQTGAVTTVGDFTITYQ